MLKRTRERGFSLVELLVVITIIGILATTVTLSLLQHTVEARQTKARAEMRAIADAVGIFRMKKGRMPGGIEDLETGGAGGRSLLTAKPVDPWGRVYLLEGTGRDEFAVRTLGADGLPGGEDEDSDLSTADEPPAAE